MLQYFASLCRLSLTCVHVAIASKRRVLPKNCTKKQIGNGLRGLEWSRDPESSRSWPQYAHGLTSPKQLEMLFSNKLVFCETTVGYPSDSLASCFFLYFTTGWAKMLGGQDGWKKSIIRSRLDCMPQLRTRLLLERFLPPSTRIY